MILINFIPEFYLKVGDYYPSEEFLNQMMEENRNNNVNGEVFFFYEGIKKYPDLFKKIYKDKAEFPDLTK